MVLSDEEIDRLVVLATQESGCEHLPLILKEMNKVETYKHAMAEVDLAKIISGYKTLDEIFTGIYQEGASMVLRALNNSIAALVEGKL